MKWVWTIVAIFCFIILILVYIAIILTGPLCLFNAIRAIVVKDKVFGLIIGFPYNKPRWVYYESESYDFWQQITVSFCLGAFLCYAASWKLIIASFYIVPGLFKLLFS